MGEPDGRVQVLTRTDQSDIPEHVAVVRLERGKFNPLNRSMQDTLITVCRRIDTDRDIRAVVLYGGERALAAGADIKEFAPRTQADMLIDGDGISRAASAVATIGKPVIAAAEGHVLGGGFELAIAADFRVSSSDASWGLPEVQLGIMPAAGGTQRLPRIVGASVAKKLMFTGTPISGAEAHRVGLVDEVTEAGGALAAALRLAATLVPMPPLALRAMKAAVDRSFDLALDVGLEYEQHVTHAIFATQDRIDAVGSFLENGAGKAVFHGE